MKERACNKPEYKNPTKSKIKRVVFAGCFAALTAVSTLVIVIPLPYGYFNAGDIFVLLSGWLLGPLYGAVAAATGSALADVIGGYTLYAPVTFAVKGITSVAAYFIYALLKKVITKDKFDIFPRLISAFTGEACMVGGYFIFESALYGFAGGAVSLAGNALQGAMCSVCAVILALALFRINFVRSLFSEKTAENKLQKENAEKKDATNEK